MTDSGIDERFDLACEVVREAGALALRYFSDLSSLKVQSKGVQDMVSDADINTENLIRDAIAVRFPDDPFLGEESASTFEIANGQGYLDYRPHRRHAAVC